MGRMTKREARKLAKDWGLPTSEEPESQEVCFIPANDYRSFLEEQAGLGIVKKGDITDRSGRKVGEHGGVYRYTIGQRHGLGIASPRPYYVMALHPGDNRVIVGRKEDLFTSRVRAEDFNWTAGRIPKQDLTVEAQIRYRHRAAPGRLEILSPRRVRMTFATPQWAVTPGQALVCYDGDRVLGGGWITEPY
jgi:tRNA-specific 2-thiouridylase